MKTIYRTEEKKWCEREQLFVQRKRTKENNKDRMIFQIMDPTPKW